MVNNDDLNPTDKLSKIRRFIEKIQTNCQKFFVPDGLAMYYGKHSYRLRPNLFGLAIDHGA